MPWARAGPGWFPVRGFRAAPHVEQNAGAIAKGPFTAGQLAEIDQVLGR
ncbi:hypothetical protein [Streptomyces hokutonensis]